MTGILAKHASDNYFDARWKDFESELDNDRVSMASIPTYFLIRTRCETCDEEATAIKYHGRRILIVPNGNLWQNHQCPQKYQIGPEEGHAEPTPEEEIDWQERADIEQEMLTQTHPDDPCVRDGDGEIRSGGWSDPSSQPRSFADPVTGYPDIPYVDPTQNTRR